jgi:hypothetical protein
MTLTYNEIASLLVEINGDGKDFKGLLKQKLSLKAKALIHRLNKIVQDEVKIFDELRLEVFKKHGDEAEGNVTIAPELAVEKPIDLSTIWTTKLNLDDVGSIETDEFYPVFLKLIEDEQK